jgi:hypothetical protein
MVRGLAQGQSGKQSENSTDVICRLFHRVLSRLFNIHILGIVSGLRSYLHPTVPIPRNVGEGSAVVAGTSRFIGHVECSAAFRSFTFSHNQPISTSAAMMAFQWTDK